MIKNIVSISMYVTWNRWEVTFIHVMWKLHRHILLHLSPSVVKLSHWHYTLKI